MLQTWTMATPKITGIRERGGSPVEGGGAKPCSTLLDEAGFIGTLATNSEFEIERYLRLGDVVSAETVLESVSRREADAPRAGPLRHLGHDLHATSTASVVGRQMFRILKFNPSGLLDEHGS